MRGNAAMLGACQIIQRYNYFVYVALTSSLSFVAATGCGSKVGFWGCGPGKANCIRNSVSADLHKVIADNSLPTAITCRSCQRW